MPYRRLWSTAALLMLAAGGAAAQAPGAAPPPPAVSALAGCWRGTGEAVGKHVAVDLVSRRILGGAMLTVDVDSHTLGRETDRYGAHLVFGGLERSGDASGDDVVAFWSDTFGGAYAVMGRGRGRTDGFDVAYGYPDATFVNRWRLRQDDLSWTITQRGKSGSEKPFASYAMTRTTCRQPDARPQGAPP